MVEDGGGYGKTALGTELVDAWRAPPSRGPVNAAGVMGVKVLREGSCDHVRSVPQTGPERLRSSFPSCSQAGGSSWRASWRRRLRIAQISGESDATRGTYERERRRSGWGAWTARRRPAFYVAS